MVPACQDPAPGGRQVIALSTTPLLKVVRLGGQSVRKMVATDVAFLQYTGGAFHRRVQAARHAVASQMASNILQCEAWFKPELSKLGTGGVSIVRTAAVSHLLADGVLLHGRASGWHEHPDSESTYLPAVITTLKKFKVNLFPAVNTCSMRYQRARVCFGRFLWPEGVDGHGGIGDATKPRLKKWLGLRVARIVEGYICRKPARWLLANRLITATSPAITTCCHRPKSPSWTTRRQPPSTSAAGEIAIRGPQVMAITGTVPMKRPMS